MTWSDIKRLFSDMHGEPLEETDHEITLEKLTVRIEGAQFLLKGSLTINNRPLADAKITLSKAGVEIIANVHDWEVEDGLFNMKDASLKLRVGKGIKAGSMAPRSDEEPPAKRIKVETTSTSQQQGWTGGLEVSGAVVINQDAAKRGRKPINIRATFVAGKQKGQWFWALCGHMDSEISLSSFITGIEEKSEYDFSLKSVSMVASNMDNPACSLTTNGYKIKKGEIRHLADSPNLYQSLTGKQAFSSVPSWRKSHWLQWETR